MAEGASTAEQATKLQTRGCLGDFRRRAACLDRGETRSGSDLKRMSESVPRHELLTWALPRLGLKAPSAPPSPYSSPLAQPRPRRRQRMMSWRSVLRRCASSAERPRRGATCRSSPGRRKATSAPGTPEASMAGLRRAVALLTADARPNCRPTVRRPGTSVGWRRDRDVGRRSAESLDARGCGLSPNGAAGGSSRLRRRVHVACSTFHRQRRDPRRCSRGRTPRSARSSGPVSWLTCLPFGLTPGGRRTLGDAYGWRWMMATWAIGLVIVSSAAVGCPAPTWPSAIAA